MLKLKSIVNVIPMISYCDCKVKYEYDNKEGYEVPKGKATIMNYIGDGKFQCPVCNNIDSHSECIYKIKVKFIKDKHGEFQINIIDMQRADGFKDKELRKTKKAFIEDFWDWIEYDTIEEGTYQLDILWNWYSSWTDCGEEWDIEMGICNQTKPIEVDSSQPLDVKQEGGNGVPPTLKSVGIPPTIL